MTRLRNYFLTGFVICAPLAITAWLTWSFVRWVDGWVKPYIPLRYTPDAYLPFAIPGFGLVVALLLITLVGFLTANLIGRTVVGWGERLLGRTPLVRSLYQALKQIFETVFSSQSSFKQAALIEYPRRGIWSIVLIATTAKGEIASIFEPEGQEMIAVFLPPTPNPTSGFLLYVPREDVKILNMGVEDAMKLVVSAGIVGPESDRPVNQAEATRIVEERARRAEVA
ncbi:MULTISPECIES: DUF502 domain-containing protein [unclassified Aureimonas]|uniref:DUF502 domain-containing protein n=1 Tax=unclassified Aureimonas TaxID=2615206 RepID=UPI0006F870FC|nr:MULTISPECIES: DUF502 domain-containing protein [unclassified Aureimonas]KQT60279.1 hypothetical protein ASG62_06310 [Aureimonas sp. Leaf427]KQT79155.1 hypothetical protein ASG54_08905 [Aureimonas sp. Leaf460]